MQKGFFADMAGSIMLQGKLLNYDNPKLLRCTLRSPFALSITAY
jgi:hypothetical protein